jgi:hypothetical protein
MSAHTYVSAQASTPVKVTKEDFHAYVRVQLSGAWNMLDSQAEQATGLSRAKYLTCIQFYKELKELHGVPEE